MTKGGLSTNTPVVHVRKSTEKMRKNFKMTNDICSEEPMELKELTDTLTFGRAAVGQNNL